MTLERLDENPCSTQPRLLEAKQKMLLHVTRLLHDE